MTANSILGRIGELLGDAELEMYRLMKSHRMRTMDIDSGSTTYHFNIGPCKETGQHMAVYVNGTPVLKMNINDAAAALEALENLW